MAEITEKKIEEPKAKVFAEPLKNPDEWWGYIPSTYLEETKNLLNTPYSDDMIEYKIVVTDETISNGEPKERKTATDTKTVVIGEEVVDVQNPNVDGRLYSLKVVENYPLVSAPNQPPIDWSLPAPNESFPSQSFGELEEITDEFKVDYFVVGNHKVNRLSFDGAKIRYSRSTPVFLKVEYGSAIKPDDIALSNEGNVIISEPVYNMYLHIKCFEKEGNFYVEKLKYSGKTGLGGAVIMTPFHYKLLKKESVNEEVFFIEYLYPNMTEYDKIDFYVEAEVVNPDRSRRSFYSKEYSLWATDSNFVEPKEKAAMLANLNEWRGKRELPKPVRNLLLDSESEEEKIKEESVFSFTTNLTDTITSALTENILKVGKVVQSPVKAVTSLKKKFGGF